MLLRSKCESYAHKQTDPSVFCNDSSVNPGALRSRSPRHRPLPYMSGHHRRSRPEHCPHTGELPAHKTQRQSGRTQGLCRRIIERFRTGAVPPPLQTTALAHLCCIRSKSQADIQTGYLCQRCVISCSSGNILTQMNSLISCW